MKEKLINYFKAAVIVCAAIFVYRPALMGNWIWDDTYEILENAEIKGPISSLFSIWIKPSSVDYFPLKASVQWLEWHAWGPNPLGYHLVSLVLHIVSALLIWRCLSKLGLSLAWWGGLLFLIHPIAVESVAWISELKNTLSLPFLLLAWDAVLEDNLDNKWSLNLKSFKIRALFWFILAMLSKSSVVMFPVTYLLYCWWKTNRISWKSFKDSIPFFSVSIVLGLVTLWFQQNRVIVGSDLGNADAITRLIASSLSILFYIKKILFPTDLIPVYVRWSITPISLEMITLWIVFIGIIIFLYKKKSLYSRSILFGLGFFGLNIVPVLGIIPMYFMRFSWVSDHFAYISFIGFIALLVAGLSNFYDNHQSSLSFRMVILSVLFSVSALFLYLTYNQSRLFSGGEAFWNRVCINDPKSWAAHYNLANALQFEPGRQKEAINQYNIALQLTPDAGQGKPGSAWHANLYARVHTNLGGLLSPFPENRKIVIEHYQRAVELDPTSSETHFNLGVMYQSDPLRKTDAITQYKETIRIEPRWVEAYYNLGNLYAELNGYEKEAIACYRKAIAIRPDYLEAHYNLGSILARTGQDLEESAKQYETVTKLNTKSIEAYLRAASVYQILNKLDAAIINYEGALKLDFRSFQAHYNLGLILAKIPERKLDAITHYEQALVLDPQSADTHYNLANLISQLPDRSEEAISHYEAAIKNKPDFLEANYNLAILLSKSTTKRNEAAQCYQNAINLNPDLYFIHYHYGLLLARDERTRNEAAKEFNKSISLNPNFEPAYKALEELKK